VRRFVELIEDSLPMGDPWGANAINVARGFWERTRVALRALAAREHELVRTLRAQGGQ